MAYDPANGGVLEILADGEVPRTFTGVARTVISGGQLVTVSGAAVAIGSTAATFKAGSIVVDLIHNDFNAVGFALNTAGSNALVTVVTRGLVIGTAAGVISGGNPVYPVSGTVQGFAPVLVTGGSTYNASGLAVGKALTASASGTNSYFLLNSAF